MKNEQDSEQPAIPPLPPATGSADGPDFISELRDLINRRSMENASNTPDFILAQYLTNCLRAWNQATQQRETWYGRDARPTSPPNKDAPLKYKVEDGKLVIEVGISTLAYCSQGKNGGPLRGCAVDERKALEWAKDVCCEFEREEENGDTPFTMFLDRMITAAKDSGSAALRFPKRKKTK